MIQTHQLTTVIEQIKALSEEERFALIAYLAQSAEYEVTTKSVEPTVELETEKTSAGGKSIRQILDDFSTGLSEESLAQMPVDGAEQHDHYIYGTFKKDV